MTIRNLNFPIEDPTYNRIVEYKKQRKMFLKDAIIELLERALKQTEKKKVKT